MSNRTTLRHRCKECLEARGLAAETPDSNGLAKAGGSAAGVAAAMGAEAGAGVAGGGAADGTVTAGRGKVRKKAVAVAVSGVTSGGLKDGGIDLVPAAGAALALAPVSDKMPQRPPLPQTSEASTESDVDSVVPPPPPAGGTAVQNGACMHTLTNSRIHSYLFWCCVSEHVCTHP